MQGIQLLAHGTQLDAPIFGFGGKNLRLTGKPVVSVWQRSCSPPCVNKEFLVAVAALNNRLSIHDNTSRPTSAFTRMRFPPRGTALRRALMPPLANLAGLQLKLRLDQHEQPPAGPQRHQRRQYPASAK